MPYHLSAVHAAVGRVQLAHFDRVVALRTALWRNYARALAAHEGWRSSTSISTTRCRSIWSSVRWGSKFGGLWISVCAFGAVARHDCVLPRRRVG
ncbi:MAG: DegT/DnrJ/EryC1/StrS family aminotransferase [Nocardia sp.]|nr:DegT/DnrJ/EryC1/StrS family aminotransferase [Nocardia sp.]